MMFLESLKRAERFASNDRRGRSMQNRENGVNQSAAHLLALDTPQLTVVAKLTYRKNVLKHLDNGREKGYYCSTKRDVR